MNTRSTLFSALIFTFSALSLHAQTLSLSLEDAMNRALQTSKPLKASELKVTQAEAKHDETGTALLPSLKFQGSYNRLSDVGPSQFENPFSPGTQIVLAQPILNNYSLGLTLSQVLFAGNRLTANRDMAEFNAKAASLDFGNDKLNTTYNVCLTYWALYKVEEMQKSVDEAVKQLEARVKDSENLFKAGMITNNDVLKLKVQLANTKVQRIDAEQQAGGLMVALNNLIGQPLTTKLELSTKPDAGQNAPSELQQAIGDAQSQRPDIMATQYRMKAAESGVEAADGGWWPQLAANANYLYANPNSRIFPSHAQFDGTWAVGLSMQWDLWTWMTPKYQAQQAAAQRDQLSQSLGAMKDGLSVEATQNYLALSPARERVTVADEALQQAEENNTITAYKYKAGTATGTEVIEAETLLLQSKVNKITAVVDYELAVAKLNHSLGK